MSLRALSVGDATIVRLDLKDKVIPACLLDKVDCAGWNGILDLSQSPNMTYDNADVKLRSSRLFSHSSA
jgi:hypothetical protein